MRGVLQLLLSAEPEAQALRERFIFVVFPMLNPDGVALGNGRANAKGYDLNRCWEQPPPGSEVEAAKRAVARCCADPGGVLAFLDLHAHSRRHGVFTLSNPGGEALPDILALEGGPLFDRQACTFRSERSKRGSARSTVWRELGVTHAHTVESGYSATPGLERLITPQDLVDVGRGLILGCAKLENIPLRGNALWRKQPARSRRCVAKPSGPAFELVV